MTSTRQQPENIRCVLACVVGLALIVTVLAICVYMQIATLNTLVSELNIASGGSLAKRAIFASRDSRAVAVAAALRARYAL